MKPKIRFKGFEGEWKASTIGEIAPLQRGYDLPTNNVISGTIPVVYSNGILRFHNEGKCQAPAIITGRSGTIGKFTYIDHGEYWPHNTSLWVTTFHKNYPRFVYYFFQNVGFEKYATGSGVPTLNRNDIHKHIESIPSNKEEQQAIASYFTFLDSQISASTSCLASLKQMKAASLQAMFPQEGETVPKIRFKGFEEEWKKMKFSELYERSSIKNDLSFGEDKIISVANMYFIKNSRQVDDDYLRSYNIMRLGDIAFEGNKSKNFAHGRLVENTIGDGIVSHVFVVMKPISKKYDLYFWKYYINNENIMGKILCRCTKSSTMMNDIVVDDFLKESILVPSYEEQIEIGKILTSLERQISLQSQRLEKLKQIKSACLDKMFV